MVDIVLDLPQPAVIVLPLPSPAALTLALPSAAVDVLPHGFIPYFDPEAVVLAAGSGSLVVAAGPVARVDADGLGITVARPVSVTVRARGSGSGVFDVLGYETARGIPAAINTSGSGETVVLVSVANSAVSSGDGVLSVPVNVAAGVAASGSGSSVVASIAGVSAAGSGAGATIVRVAPRVVAAGSGSGSTVVSASTFDSSGMNKSGSQALTSTNTWQRLTSFTVRAGYSGTKIVDDGILVPAGVVVNYTANVQFAAAPGPSATQYARLVNGSSAGSPVSYSGYGTSPLVITGQFTGTGEIVRIEVMASTLGSSRGSVSASGTYLTLEKV